MTVARHRALKQLRRDARYREKLAAFEQAAHTEAAEQDGRLRLMFMCCYPALSRESQVALTLRAVSRRDLAEDAAWLTAYLTLLYPRGHEPLGLLALMHLQLARAEARFDPAGELVLLANQDRSRWNRQMISEAVAMIERAAALKRPGQYQVQAALAEVENLAGDLADYHLFHAIRGELLLELGRREQAWAANCGHWH